MPIHPTKFCNVMMWEAVIINWKNIYIKSCTNNSKLLHLIRSILDKTGYTDLLNYKSMNSYASFNKWRSTCWGLSRYWSLQMLRLVLTSWWRWRPVIIVTSPSSSSLRKFFLFFVFINNQRGLIRWSIIKIKINPIESIVISILTYNLNVIGFECYLYEKI